MENKIKDNQTRAPTTLPTSLPSMAPSLRRRFLSKGVEFEDTDSAALEQSVIITISIGALCMMIIYD